MQNIYILENAGVLDTIPATPDGKPTPAIITKTALELFNIPITVLDVE